MMCIVIASRDARERARFDPSSRYGHTAFAAGAGFDTKAELFQRQPECPTGHLTRTDPDHEHTRSAEKMYKPVERCFENPERGPGPGDECHVVLTARNMADPRRCISKLLDPAKITRCDFAMEASPITVSTIRRSEGMKAGCVMTPSNRNGGDITRLWAPPRRSNPPVPRIEANPSV